MKPRSILVSHLEQAPHIAKIMFPIGSRHGYGNPGLGYVVLFRALLYRCLLGLCIQGLWFLLWVLMLSSFLTRLLLRLHIWVRGNWTWAWIGNRALGPRFLVASTGTAATAGAADAAAAVGVALLCWFRGLDSGSWSLECRFLTHTRFEICCVWLLSLDALALPCCSI